MILCGNHPRNAKVYHADVSAAQLCFAGQTMPVFNRDGSLVLPADFMCGCPKGELLGPCEHSAENPYSNEALGREAARSLDRWRSHRRRPAEAPVRVARRRRN